MITLSATVLALAAGVLAGCAAGPAPVAASPRDPSSPSAPEGPRVAVAALAPTAEHADHAQGDRQAVDYVCPMHPEVTSKAPGVCPKCNMKLVPKS